MKQTFKLTEHELKNLIRESLMDVLPQDGEQNTSFADDEIPESISFDTMHQIFNELGISIIGQREVENRQTGDTGTRYELETPKGFDTNVLEQRLKEAAENPDGVFVSVGKHRYAPEITRVSVVVVDM